MGQDESEIISFQEAASLVLQKLYGVTDPGEDYLAGIERLDEACADWHRERAPKFGFLELHLPDPRVGLIGTLDAAGQYGLCGNAAARDFLRFIDCRTSHRCTLMQLQVVIALQDITRGCKGVVNASGGAA